MRSAPPAAAGEAEEEAEEEEKTEINKHKQLSDCRSVTAGLEGSTAARRLWAERPAHVSGNLSSGNAAMVPAARRLLLLSLCLGFLAVAATACPSCCLCASDIVSCSGRNLSAPPSDLPGYATRLDLSHNALAALPAGWIPPSVGRLAALLLSRNAISRIEADAFAATPHLLHLDLSSNRLAALNSSVFAGLPELTELLLFGNRIAQIHAGAFSGLHGLRRLYLSGNRLTAFPLGLYWEPGGPRNLTFLDLSYNRISAAPVQRLLSLTQRGGVYLQENPLVCDCALVGLLEFWRWRQYRPLVDFGAEYPCGEEPGASDCSQEGAPDAPLKVQTYQVEPGKGVRVPCPGFTPGAEERRVVFWVTPRTVVNSSTADPKARLTVSPNGTLQIRAAVPEDAGVYGCVAARGRRYAPYESPNANVVVGNQSGASASGLSHRGGAEHFNTAFTTLASCVVSIVLVLLYLYLTPCRCREGRAGGSRGCGGRAVALCADPREEESGQRRSNGKRVAFLEPQAEESVGGGQKTPAITAAPVSAEGILKNGSRTAGRSCEPDQLV